MQKIDISAQLGGGVKTLEDARTRQLLEYNFFVVLPIFKHKSNIEHGPI